MNHQTHFSIRSAIFSDASLILTFMKERASYEKMSDQVMATVEAIEKTLPQSGQKLFP